MRCRGGDAWEVGCGLDGCCGVYWTSLGDDRKDLGNAVAGVGENADGAAAAVVVVVVVVLDRCHGVCYVLVYRDHRALREGSLLSLGAEGMSTGCCSTSGECLGSLPSWGQRCFVQWRLQPVV